MTIERNQPNRGNRKGSARLIVWLDAVHELMFSDASRTILKNLAINLSIAGSRFTWG